MFPAFTPGRRLLIVGRVDALRPIAAQLREALYRVDVSYEVESALKMASGGDYDAVLCELSISSGAGFKVLEQLQQRDAVPIILIIRTGERQDLIEAVRLGAFDYLEEPFDFHDVTLAIGRAVVHRQLVSRLRRNEARLERLEHALRRMNATADKTALSSVLAGELPDLLEVDRFSVYRYDGERLSLAISTHLDPARERPIYVARQSGPMRDAVLRGQPIVSREAGPPAAHSVSAPMFVENELVGVLVLERLRDQTFQPEDLHFHQAVASHVGSAFRMRERTEALEAALSDLRKAQAALIRSERVAAVGKLAAGISHELKNPLMSMTFAVQNLRDQLAAELARAEVAAPLESLADDIRRMRDRVQAFLSVTRPREGQPRPVRADEVVHRAVEAYRRDPRAARMAIREEFHASPLVRVDEDQLYAAVSNLVLNAIEALATQEAGTIAVGVESSELRVRISVADDGPGVPQEARERIFDVFFTTKEAGTGLGLSQVSVFAERAGGRVFLADTELGSRFVLELPEESA